MAIGLLVHSTYLVPQHYETVNVKGVHVVITAYLLINNGKRSVFTTEQQRKRCFLQLDYIRTHARTHTHTHTHTHSHTYIYIYIYMKHIYETDI